MENEDARDLKFSEEIEKAKCLSLSEVSLILKQTTQNRSHVKLPLPQTEVFHQVQEYANRFSKQITSKEYIKGMRKALDQYNLHEFEIASLVNLCPGNTDEALTLIPSLKRIDEQSLQIIMYDLESYANPQDEDED